MPQGRLDEVDRRAAVKGMGGMGVAQRVRARRTYVLEEDGERVFKVDIGSRSRFGAELENLYTVPSQRGK